MTLVGRSEGNHRIGNLDVTFVQISRHTLITIDSLDVAPILQVPAIPESHHKQIEDPQDADHQSMDEADVEDHGTDKFVLAARHVQTGMAQVPPNNRCGECTEDRLEWVNKEEGLV